MQIVLSVDEKSQLQPLERTQPGLPMKKRRGETMTHDCKRHGITTLFAALNTLDGSVLSQCRDRHTNEDRIAFVRLIAKQTPRGKQIHIIADNYAAHKHPHVREWLKKNPRFHVHFTPTSASWLNIVERFFRDITHNRIRRGVFHSVPEPITAIDSYVAQHNRCPKPFNRTARAERSIRLGSEHFRFLDLVKFPGSEGQVAMRFREMCMTLPRDGSAGTRLQGTNIASGPGRDGGQLWPQRYCPAQFLRTAGTAKPRVP